MRSKLVFAVFFVLVSGMAMAQSGDVEPEPGLITADSSLYALDVAYDNAFRNSSEVAFERASEFAVAKENNKSKAMQRAEKNLNNSVAKVASSNSTEGLFKAQSVLEQVRDNTPEEADKGLDDAIEMVSDARERAGNGSGSGKPDDVGKP